MNKLVDLHTHSTFSDGHYTPTQLVEEAVTKGLTALSITDHDSWNGIGEALEAAQGHNITIIPGVELGSQVNGESVHILAYHIDTTNIFLQAKMDEMRYGRERRLIKILEKLKNLGYHIEVEACDPKNRAVGRPHVAKALVAKGYFGNVQEAFDVLLKNGGPAYVPQPKLAPDEAVELVHNAGGIAILAHPSELSDGELPERLISTIPFDGIEVYHPSSSDKNEFDKWLHLAEKYKLLVGGGSDFHGILDRFPTELGIWKVKYDAVKGIIEYKK